MNELRKILNKIATGTLMILFYLLLIKTSGIEDSRVLTWIFAISLAFYVGTKKDL